MATLAEAFGKVVSTIIKALISGMFEDVLSPILGTISSVTSVDAQGIAAELDAYYNRYVAPHLSPGSAHSPVSPADAYMEASRVFTDYFNMVGKVNMAAIVCEAATMGQVEAAGYNSDRLLGVAGMQAVTSQIVKSEFDAKLLLPLKYYYNKLYEPGLPDPKDAALMWARGWASGGSVTDAMSMQGIPTGWISSMLNNAFTRPDVATLTDMLYRGLVDKAGFLKGLKMLGISEADQTSYLALTEWIPPIQDLRLMAVREAFPVEPGPPQYEELYKWGALHGLSRYWTDRYLYMGFIRMDPRFAMDYFLYRNDLPADYAAWLRIADIHPDDRAPMVSVAYRPPTLYQARRGWEAGIYADEDLIRFNRWRGMNPSDAETAAMADFEWVLRADRTALEGDLQKDYLAGYATIEQIRADLTALGFSEKRIDLRINHYEALAKNEHRDALVTIWTAAYEKDLIDDATLKTNLETIIVRPEVVGRILEREYVKKYAKPKAA